jgi:hypothetical protein
MLPQAKLTASGHLALRLGARPTFGALVSVGHDLPHIRVRIPFGELVWPIVPDGVFTKNADKRVTRKVPK